MQPVLRSAKRRVPLLFGRPRVVQLLVRHASLTGAISRGVREAQRSAEDRRGRYDDLGHSPTRRRLPRSYNSVEEESNGSTHSDTPWRDGDVLGENEGRGHPPRSGYEQYGYSTGERHTPSMEHRDLSQWRSETNNVHRTRNARWHDKKGTSSQVAGQNHKSDKNVDYLTEAPRTIPYTAADSQFLYGLHSIQAALRANRRLFHKLYVYVAEDGGVRSDAEKELYRLAAKASINTIRVGGPDWKQKLSQLAAGRAHNGFVLEASPIPAPVIKSINEVDYAGASWQPQADGPTPLQALVANAQNRFPLLLLLDGITDMGNVGAILRSVSFFGVDGVLMPEFNSTGAGPMLKASAGSSEYVPLFRIRHDFDFLSSCQSNGWHIATSVAPGAEIRVVGAHYPRPAASRQTPDRILESKPVILVLGSEGEGVRPRISRLSDSFISIHNAPTVHPGLDSLNVSIAAALLMRDLVGPFLDPKTNIMRDSDPFAERLERQSTEDLF